MAKTKTVRKIVTIDEERCNGCGLCVPACDEGAIQIINGKAKLIAENLCDGLGDCLGECPQGAISIVEREAEEFDEAAVEERLCELGAGDAHGHAAGGCPGAAAMGLGASSEAREAVEGEAQPSQLGNWPLQLALVPVHAPWLDGADLLIAADCAPFALGSFHSDLLAGKQVIIGCPKLDDVEPYLHKLTEIFRTREIERVTVARMGVPCCAGLSTVVQRALQLADSNIPYEEVIVKIGG